MLEMGLKYCKPKTFHSHKIFHCKLAFSHLVKSTKLFMQRAALVLAQAQWLTKRGHHILVNGIFFVGSRSQ
jgi:hypothetical protein